MNVPPMDNSAMDGYAVRLADLKGPGRRLKVSQKIPAGSTGKALAPGTAARIFTGAPIPGGADAIVMQEDCMQEGDEVVVKKVPARGDRKSTRLNSSHSQISYAVFCLKKKKKQ